MPTVSLYGGPRVATEALPDARARATETAASAGVDLANAQAQTSLAGAHLAGQAEDISVKILEHQNQVATLDADNQRTELETDLKWNPKGGAFTVQGMAAVDNVDPTLAKYDEGVSKISASLRNGAQREMFGRVADQGRANLHLDLERYAHGESMKADEQTTAAAVTNKGESAISNALDPPRATQDLADQRKILDDAAKRLGWSPEVLELKKDQASTAAAVVKRVIDEGNLPAAQAYYDMYGPGKPATADTPAQPGLGWIKGEQLGKIELALREGGIRAESQTQADKIIADGGTYREQITRAGAIADPQVRDAVTTRIKQNDEANQRDAREQHETLSKHVYDALEASPDPRKTAQQVIPATVWSQLSGGERDAATKYYERLTVGTEPEKNGPTYYKLFTEATYSPTTFAKRNLYPDKGDMTDGEFKQLLEVRRSITDGDAKKVAEQTAGFRSNDEILTDNLNQYPELFPHQADIKDRTPAERNAIAIIRQQLDAGIVGWEQDHPGKKVSPVEKQQILNGIMTRTITQKTPVSWFRDLTTTQPNVGTFWNPALQETRPVLGLTIADVPAEARAQIEAAAKGHGLTPTDTMILNAYIAQQYAVPRKPK